MNKFLCSILPYREETWASQLARFNSNPVEDAKYGKVSQPYYDETISKKMKWHWGHDLDITAHGPSGSLFICIRCRKTF